MRINRLLGDLSPIGAAPHLGVFATSPDPVLNDLVRLTAQVCNSSVAAVMLVEGNRCVYKAAVGIGLTQKPRRTTPCETTVVGTDIFEIPDAYLDEVFSDTGISMAGKIFRFYAGIPLRVSAGQTVGTLFVLDTMPRKLTDAQRTGLTILGRQVVAQLELGSRMREVERATRVQQRTDTALTVERNFVSAVLDTIGALVAVFDSAGRIVRFNRACETISGYTSGELLGGYIWGRLIPSEDVPDAMKQFESIRAGAFPATFENYWKTRTGELHRIAWSATALLDEQKQVAFVIATGIDVTMQRAAESTLKESESRYRQLVEGSLGMVCTHDVNGVLLSLNRHGAEGLGRTTEEMVGHSLAEFMPSKAVPLFQEYLGQMQRTGEAQGLLHLKSAKGDIRVVAYRNRQISPPGSDPYVLGFGVDVSDKVRAEGELRSLVRQSNSILESIGDGICGLDLQGRLTVINAAGAQMLGYKPEEMLGRSMHELFHYSHSDGSPYPWESSPVYESIQKLETVRVSTEVFWRRDGTSFAVDYVARPQIDSDVRPGSAPNGGQGRAVGVVIAFTDITERRALDLLKDEFISTVSHELRTPLTSLRAALGLIQSGTLSTRPEKTKQMLDIAVGSADRLVRLVNDILDIERISSGKAELHYTLCNVEDLLCGAMLTKQAEADKRKITITTEANGTRVWADAARVMQTVGNLVSNAIKFSPEASLVTLSATYLPDDEVQIQVQDRGRGIAEDKLEQIFDRFRQIDSSDSRAMGGSGLGLAICRSIVLQHGGRIWAASKPGEGSSFFFTLPTKPSEHLS